MGTWTFVINVCRIYGIHDEAKDKDFELEMSWVCDESNRLHQKVTEILRKDKLERELEKPMLLLCMSYMCVEEDLEEVEFHNSPFIIN